MASFDTLPAFIAVSTVLFTLSYYVGFQTLEHMSEKGIVDNEWKPVIEYLASKPSLEKPKPAALTVDRVKEVAEAVKTESIQITKGIISKLDSTPTKVLTVPEKVIDVVKSTISNTSQKTPDKPNTYIKKGYSRESDPLETLPYLVSAPFRTCEYVFEKSTDLAAGSIRMMVLNPLRISKQVFGVISKPFSRH